MAPQLPLVKKQLSVDCSVPTEIFSHCERMAYSGDYFDRTAEPIRKFYHEHSAVDVATALFVSGRWLPMTFVRAEMLSKFLEELGA